MQLNATIQERGAGDVAHARINIPIDLHRWSSLPSETSEQLLWFHQHCLDHKLNGKSAAEALSYREEGESLIFRILNGTYEGDWDDVLERIADFKRIVQTRDGIQRATFTKNPISNMIFAALDYAMANNSITLIEGDSGHGKTVSGEAWRDAHNHGRTVMIEVPPVGGPRDFVRAIAATQGVSQRDSTGVMLDGVCRSFNEHRMLILDQADRLLPKRGEYAEKLDILHAFHDRTRCPVGLLCTSRLRGDMEGNAYQFEQILGRIGMSVILPSALEETVYRPLVVQYFPRPSKKLLEACHQLANNQLPRQKGRLRLLSQVLRLSSRIASNAKPAHRLTENDFFTALALRSQMMGEYRKEA